MGGICCTDEDRLLDKQVQTQLTLSARNQEKTHKLLLLGPGNSGKSTFFKQLCKIHGAGFQDEDVEMAQQNIYDCVLDQMKQLIDSCNDNIKIQQKYKSKKEKKDVNLNNYQKVLTDEEKEKLNDDDDDYEYELLDDDFEYKLEGKAKEYADYLTSSKLPRGGIEVTSDIADMIDFLWKNKSIQRTFYHRKHLGVVDSAPHFFDDIKRIGSHDFQPTSDDILLVRIPTTGIREERFTIEGNTFIIVDVGGQRNERSKWVHQFDTVSGVLFVTSLSCYDQMLFEVDGINAMHESIRLFDNVVNNRYFRRTSMIIFFNKLDLFEDKIKEKSLRICFENYKGQDNDCQAALQYIKQVFISCCSTTQEIYAHFTTATNEKNVKKVFTDVQNSVVMAALKRNGIL